MTAREDVIERAARVIVDVDLDHDYESGDLASPEEYAHALADAGLLATPRPLPSRDEIDRAVGSVVWNAMNHPAPEAVLGQDITPLRTKITDAVLALLHQAPERDVGVETPDCGGCQGQGAHSPACHTQPGAYWYRVAQHADALGDLIGPNDAMASTAWGIAEHARNRRDEEMNR